MMDRKFKFRLQKVLEYREHREKQAQRELTGARGLLSEAEAELSTLQEKLKESQKPDSELISNSFNLTHSLVQSRYVMFLSGCINSQNQVVGEKSKEVDSKRLSVAEAVQNRKTLSTLKEKKLESYARELNQQEQKNCDELALFTVYRQLPEC
jgi:flagellar protein FliJ